MKMECKEELRCRPARWRKAANLVLCIILLVIDVACDFFLTYNRESIDEHSALAGMVGRRTSCFTKHRDWCRVVSQRSAVVLFGFGKRFMARPALPDR